MSIFYLSISFDILLLDKFLSGRISAWSNMLDIYYNYDFLEKLFGKGYGSDFFYQDVWLGIKNSHSCFLEYLFIGGFLSVLLLLDILVKIGRSSMFILLIVLLLSAFSNGLMYMPIHFMYFMFLCKFISTQISDPWNYYCNKNKLK